jgi:hypothetical protein
MMGRRPPAPRFAGRLSDEGGAFWSSSGDDAGRSAQDHR